MPLGIGPSSLLGSRRLRLDDLNKSSELHRVAREFLVHCWTPMMDWMLVEPGFTGQDERPDRVRALDGHDPFVQAMFAVGGRAIRLRHEPFHTEAMMQRSFV
jgi:hypothetical protein